MSENNVYFRNNASAKQKSYKYTEHITQEQLNAPAGAHALGSIRRVPDEPKNSEPVKKRKGKKKSRLKRVLTAALCIILILLTAASGLAVYSVHYILEDYTPQVLEDNEYAQEDALLYSDKVINILIIGMDTLSTDSRTRSDTMLLLSADTENRQIKLTSFLRDTYSYIPGYGTAKLNAACTYGGAQLVCDTVEYNFGVRIDAYIMTGYDMFIRIIEAAGGITVAEIDEKEALALADEGFSIPAGGSTQLSGEEALAYCRIRKGQDDFFRTERQREVISAVIDKISAMPPDELIRTAHKIAGSIQCSLTKEELIALAFRALPCLSGLVAEMSVPAPGTWHNETVNGQAVLSADLEANKQKLNEFLYN